MQLPAPVARELAGAASAATAGVASGPEDAAEPAAAAILLVAAGHATHEVGPEAVVGGGASADAGHGGELIRAGPETAGGIVVVR